MLHCLRLSCSITLVSARLIRPRRCRLAVKRTALRVGSKIVLMIGCRLIYSTTVSATLFLPELSWVERIHASAEMCLLLLIFFCANDITD
jgi:hypothetical protein